MKLLELKNKFYTELHAIYPTTEIDAFFYLLAEEFLDLKRVDIALQFNKKIDVPVVFKQAIKALETQKPIQYILGKTNFYDLEFQVDDNVLIPRPETEELVDWIILDNKSKATLEILDIGTGSGCIAITLAKNLQSKVAAIDVSTEAINLAKKNAKTNNVSIDFIKEDILTSQGYTNTWDIIVSNPPYVRNLEKKKMKNNVLDFEPHLALFVENNDPLIFYRAIADFAIAHLSKNGILYFEINQYLSKETIQLLKSKGFNNIELRKDIFNNSRMLKAKL